MKIIITEEQKNKLFIPRKLSGEDNRYYQWNKEQPIINGVKINQYDSDGNKIGLWLDYPDKIKSNYNKTKDFLSNIFNNLTVKGDYYLYDNERYMRQDLKNNVLWVRYGNFWKVLSDRYSLDYYEIQELIKIWMEMTYKFGSLTPTTGFIAGNAAMEMTYKLGSLTPNYGAPLPLPIDGDDL